MKPSVILICSAGILAGCTAGRDYERPDTSTFEQETDLVASAQATGDGPFVREEPVEEWWRRFNDPILSSLSDKAVSNNKNISAAIETVFAARSIQDEVEFDRFPTVEARAGFVRQRLSRDGIGGAAADRTFNTYDAGFDALWELDIFGRISRSIEAAEAETEAAEADLAALMVTILSDVGRGYIELRGAQLELNVAERNVRNQSETLDLITRQADSGRASNLDVVRARSQLRLSEATIPPLKARVTAAINRLGVLTGETPGLLEAELSTVQPLPSMPESVAVGDATSLIRRRPDLRAAERRVQAATARYGVAAANLYPSVSILGSIGFQSISLSDFGSGPTNRFSVGPQINWAAFNLGRVQAQVAQADAQARSALLTFEQSVLEALEEIQTAMSNFNREEERRQSLVEAASAAGSAARLSRVRYEGGLDDFLDVLDAERTLLQAENQLAVSETTVALNLIAVYKALGGGWQQNAAE